MLARITFVTFINKSYDDTKKKMRCLKPDQAQSKCPVALYHSRLIYFQSLGVNGEKKSMKTKILLIKVDISHFTLVNLEILRV